MARWLGQLAVLAAAWMVAFLITLLGDPLTMLLSFGSVLAIEAVCYLIGRASARCCVGRDWCATAEPLRARWQFTLRELLLFMLAFCLLMALIMSSRPLHPTPFYNAFVGETIVKAACDRQGLKFYNSGGPQSSSGGPAVREP